MNNSHEYGSRAVGGQRVSCNYTEYDFPNNLTHLISIYSMNSLYSTILSNENTTIRMQMFKKVFTHVYVFGI